jgi:hypothetical protein
MPRELPHLRLVEAGQRPQRRAHVAPQGEVAEQPFGAVARPHDECIQGRRLVVEDRHPLARHLVATAATIGVRKAPGVRVGLLRDVNLQALRARERDGGLDVLARLGRQSAVGHQYAGDAAFAQRLRSEQRHHRGIETPGKPDHGAAAAGLFEDGRDELDQYPPHPLAVYGKLIGHNPCSSRSRPSRGQTTSPGRARGRERCPSAVA